MSNYKNYDERFTFEGGSGGGTTVKNIEAYLAEPQEEVDPYPILWANAECTEYLDPQDIIDAFESGGNIYIKHEGDISEGKIISSKLMNVMDIHCSINTINNIIFEMTLRAHYNTDSQAETFAVAIDTSTLDNNDSQSETGEGGNILI